MEDYIFLIIAVVLSIFAALKKNKKPEQTPISGSPDKSRHFLMDQFLGDDFPEDQDEDFVEPTAVRVALKKEPLIVNSQPSRPGFYRSEFRSNLSFRSDSKSVKVAPETNMERGVEDSDAESDSGYMADFSLRKAFVYSEIMNRKYGYEMDSDHRVF